MYRQLEKMTISATTGPGPWGQFQLPYKDGPTWKMIGSRAEHLSVFVCWFVALALLLCVLCAVDDVVCELLCCGCCGCPPASPFLQAPGSTQPSSEVLGLPQGANRQLGRNHISSDPCLDDENPARSPGPW